MTMITDSMVEAARNQLGFSPADDIRLRAALTAALAAAWRPIEDAPPIGHDVLATGEPEWPGRVAIGRVMADGSFSWDVDDSNAMWGPPTRWMPLPEPPKGVEG